jgi:hypothetical protein
MIPQLHTSPSNYPLYQHFTAGTYGLGASTNVDSENTSPANYRQYPSFIAGTYGLGVSTNVDSEKSIDSHTVDPVPSVASTAGSVHEWKQDTITASETTRGVLSSIWKKITEIPSVLSRRRVGLSETKKEEEESVGSSALADDGANSVSWAGMSLDSLGAWTDFQESVDTNKWWELGSSLIIDRTPCGNPLSTTGYIESDNGNESITGSCTSTATVCQDTVDRDTNSDLFLTPTNVHSHTAVRKNTNKYEDDPWCAAKRGDIDAIQQWVEDKHWDWSQVDDFGNTALFYACHSGAAINLAIVKVLLDQWPVDQIPANVMDRCKLNALNRSVVKMLENPDTAEDIIVATLSDLELCEEGDDEETLHLRKWLLYDLEEGEEDEEDSDY